MHVHEKEILGEERLFFQRGNTYNARVTSQKLLVYKLRNEKFLETKQLKKCMEPMADFFRNRLNYLN